MFVRKFTTTTVQTASSVSTFDLPQKARLMGIYFAGKALNGATVTSDLRVELSKQSGNQVATDGTSNVIATFLLVSQGTVSAVAGATQYISLGDGLELDQLDRLNINLLSDNNFNSAVTNTFCYFK